MRFQLANDYPVGSWLVPGGTFIEGTDPVWNGVKLWPMPVDAIAQDIDAANALVAWHGEASRHLLRFAPGISPDPSRPLPVGVAVRERTG